MQQFSPRYIVPNLKRHELLYIIERNVGFVVLSLEFSTIKVTTKTAPHGHQQRGLQSAPTANQRDLHKWEARDLVM